MAATSQSAIAVIGIDIGKNSFHVVGLDGRGAIVLRQKWPRGQVETRFANMSPCLIGMEACVGAHHLSRKLKALGHDARLMPARYVRPYSKGQKNDFRDAEAIAEAVQRPTMKFVVTKTADQLDLQALHRVRERLKLKIGEDIPTPNEMRAIITKLPELEKAARFRPLLLTAIFTGLRASELRGLRWVDVDLKRGELQVHQRADRFCKIGRPKSEASERAVPLPPMLISVLREHRLACPNGELGLVFPNTLGGVDHRISIVKCGFHPAQVLADVVDRNGRAKYPGLHSLRHFYASWCINRRVDGGLELPLKVVQARLGHASIQMTADAYGHLFPRGDDGSELAAAERAFVG